MYTSDVPTLPSKINILIVDDTPENLLALEALLAGTDRNILKASSGLEALRHLLEKEVAVILLDVQMTDLNGYDTTALIRERDRTRSLPIILLTAHRQEDWAVARGYAVGATDYVFMPAAPDVLRAKVDFFVEQAKRTAALKNRQPIPSPHALVVGRFHREHTGVDAVPTAAPPRLLVVDDDPAALQSVADAVQLRLKGALVDMASSGVEAERKLREADYDTILTDIKMPGMDGVTLLEKIKELSPTTPTLLMTGHGERTLGVQALEAGAFAYIEKPVDRDFLIAWLKRAIQLRQLSRQVAEQNRALKRWTEKLEEVVEERTAALRESEQRLVRVLDATVEGIYDWNIQTGHVSYSKKWVESLGYASEEVPPHVSFWESIVHSEDMPRIREALQDHFKGHTVLYQMEARYRRKDGSYRWMFDRGKVVERDEAGNPVRMVGSDTDVTERKQAEEITSHLAAIVISSDDAIISVDLHGIVTSWNLGAQRLFGYGPAEMIGQPEMILIPSGNPKEELEILERIRRGERLDHYQTVRRGKDGRDIEISLTVSPITDATGKVIGASQIARHITDQRQE